MSQNMLITLQNVKMMLKIQELEEIEDTWKTEARHQRDRIDQLEEENHRLNVIIRDKTVDDQLQAGMT